MSLGRHTHIIHTAGKHDRTLAEKQREKKLYKSTIVVAKQPTQGHILHLPRARFGHECQGHRSLSVPPSRKRDGYGHLIQEVQF